MAKQRERLDERVSREANVPVEKARGIILAGQVFSERGERLDKPAQPIELSVPLDIRFSPKYVSRGGDKLEAALTGFSIDMDGAIGLDVGASTGGFTDCLLQHGARHVYAVDVGYGQFAWKLREDARVTLIERTNIRNLDLATLPDPATFFVVDCSFISLTQVLPSVVPHCAADARGVVLIKPQFEAGKTEIEEGGVVRDPAIRTALVEHVLACARELGFTNCSVIPSPLLGPAGNVEFLAYLQRGDHA